MLWSILVNRAGFIKEEFNENIACKLYSVFVEHF